MAMDLDDVLAYTTERKVVIRHRWVGGLYYSTMVCILAYVVVELVINKQYNSIMPLAGSIRATVHSPADYAPLETLPYCSNAYDIPCVRWDQSLWSTVQPDVGLLVPTRVKLSAQERSECDLFNYSCTPWVNTNAADVEVFMGDVENSTILIQHAVSEANQLVGYNSSVVNTFQSGRPTPTVYGKHGTFDAQEWCDCTSAPANRPAPPGGCAAAAGCHDVGDLLTLGQLLSALGLDLSSGATDNAETLETLRYAGLTVRLGVVYDSATSYHYLATANEIEAKLQSIDRLNDTSRVVQDVHGVQLLFAQGTGYPYFDPRTMLLTLVTGLGLMSVAKTIADSFLLYVAPRRNDYNLFTVTYTPDFSPDNPHEQQVLDEILSKKRAKRLLKTSSRSTLDGGGAEGLSAPLAPNACPAFSTDPWQAGTDGGAAASAGGGGGGAVGGGGGAAPHPWFSGQGGPPRASGSAAAGGGGGGPRLRSGAEPPTAPLCAKSMQQ